MAKRGTPEWKENIKNGVKDAWLGGKYESVDYSKTEEQKQKLSKAKTKFYQMHPEVAKQHSEMLKGKMIGNKNPNYGKKHPGLNAKDKNHFWQGGVSVFTARGFNWKRISQEIRVRDNHTCQCCGAKENLHVHHKVPYRLTRDNTPKNLITLCNRCHKKLEN